MNIDTGANLSLLHAECDRLRAERDTCYADFDALESKFIDASFRGDTYRRRALVLLKQCHQLRHADDLTPEEEAHMEQLIQEYEANKSDFQVLGIMRRDLDRLTTAEDRAQRLADALRKAMTWSEFYDEQLDELEAALAEPGAPDAVGEGQQ